MLRKIIAAVLIALFCQAICLAVVRVDPNDVNGSSWVLYGKMSMRASHIGSSSTSGCTFVDFDPNGTVWFADDDQKNIMTGTYSIDANTNKVLINFDQDYLENLLEGYIQEEIDEAGVGDYIQSYDVNISEIKSVNKVKYKKAVINLTTAISVKAKLTLEAYDRSFYSDMTLKFNFSGDRPLNQYDPNWLSKWDIVAGKIRGSDKTQGAVAAPVDFNLAVSIIEGKLYWNNYFEMQDLNGVPSINGPRLRTTFSGYFARIDNKFYFFSGTNSTGFLIEDMFLAQYCYYLKVTDSTASITATLSNSSNPAKRRISINSLFHYNGEVDPNGCCMIQSKGSFKLSGKGTPIPFSM